jgi:hypothetical protein
MNDSIDHLSETFSAHEHLAPEATDVLARANAIARNYRRRRWAVKATGGAFLGAGIVAGGIAVPSHIGSKGGTAKITPAESPTPTPSPSYTKSQEMTAYFDAGYDYANAQDLAQLWGEGVYQAKADGGLKLLEGGTLPVKPNEDPISPTQSQDDAAVQAFFAAGYTYDDAVTLGNIWNESSYAAKGDGGQKLLNGDKLPIPPSGKPDPNAGSNRVVRIGHVPSVGVARKNALEKAGLLRAGKVIVSGKAPADSSGESAADDAFFNAGYDYNDAVALGQIWNETDITQIKSEAGQKLLNGDTLPVKPSGSPASPEDQNVAAFFNAGYTMNDAIKLGKMWNESPYQAKVDGGKKLQNGETLPIAP